MDAPYPKRVLIFENEFLIALDLADVLATMGIESLQAQNAEEAITLLRTDPQIDFALVNFHARGVDQVVEMLRVKNIRFAVCSGCSVDEIKEAFGAVPLLPKPFADTDLVKLIRSLFDVSGRAASA